MIVSRTRTTASRQRSCVNDRGVILEPRERGFLDEDMLARRERAKRQVTVEARGHGDDHRVHARIVEGIHVVPVAAAAIELAAIGRRLAGIAARIAGDEVGAEGLQLPLCTRVMDRSRKGLCAGVCIAPNNHTVSRASLQLPLPATS